MARQALLKDEQIIYDSMKAIRGIPESKIEFMLKKVGGPFAGTFRLSGPWGERYYYIKLVPKLTPTLADLVIHQIKTSPAPLNAKPLLVSHYISPKITELLKKKGIEYADCAGNLFLNQMPLYVEVGGQKHRLKAPTADRLFRPAGLKLIYQLLRSPLGVNATYRTLAEDADIALGAIGSLFKELEKRGNLFRDAEGKRSLGAAEELLQRWQLGYMEALRPKLFLERCSFAGGSNIAQLTEQLRAFGAGKQILVGGELGAQLMSGGFNAESAVLYLDPEQQLKTMLHLHLVPDPDGPVDLLQTFGRQCHWSGMQPQGLTLADPLLLFAELSGPATDRVASRLYQQYLQPRFGG
jgi:hypothetical protein